MRVSAEADDVEMFFFECLNNRLLVMCFCVEVTCVVLPFGFLLLRHKYIRTIIIIKGHLSV